MAEAQSIKVESPRLPSSLWIAFACYTYKNEVNRCTENTEQNNLLNAGRLVVLPSNHIGSDRYMRQKMHTIIAISNILGHPDIFVAMTCNPNWPETKNVLLLDQGKTIGPRCLIVNFASNSNFYWSILRKTNLSQKITAFVSVIEFQKLGLVQAHAIIFSISKPILLCRTQTT